jgi:hypothetical protein
MRPALIAILPVYDGKFSCCKSAFTMAASARKNMQFLSHAIPINSGIASRAACLKPHQTANPPPLGELPRG